MDVTGPAVDYLHFDCPVDLTTVCDQCKKTSQFKTQVAGDVSRFLVRVTRGHVGRICDRAFSVAALRASERAVTTAIDRIVSEKHLCFILSTGTRMRIDSVMRPRSSSRRHNTSASITVTVTELKSLPFFIYFS